MVLLFWCVIPGHPLNKIAEFKVVVATKVFVISDKTRLQIHASLDYHQQLLPFPARHGL